MVTGQQIVDAARQLLGGLGERRRSGNGAKDTEFKIGLPEACDGHWVYRARRK